jgi:hypothetical protein
VLLPNLPTRGYAILLGKLFIAHLKSLLGFFAAHLQCSTRFAAAHLLQRFEQQKEIAVTVLAAHWSHVSHETKY